MPPGNQQIETAPSAVRQGGSDEPVGIIRKRRVGVEEQQAIARGERDGRIHRRGAAARSGNDPVGERPRQVARAVARAAVDDNHLDAARA